MDNITVISSIKDWQTMYTATGDPRIWVGTQRSCSNVGRAWVIPPKLSKEQLPVLSFNKEGLRTFFEPLSLIYPCKQTAAIRQSNEQNCNRLLQSSKASRPGTKSCRSQESCFHFFSCKNFCNKVLLQVLISLVKTNCLNCTFLVSHQ